MKKRIFPSILFILGLCSYLQAQTSCNADAGEPIVTTFDVCPDNLAALSFDDIFGSPTGDYTDINGNVEDVATIQALVAVNDMNDIITISNGPAIDLSSLQVGETACIYTLAYAPSTVAISANTLCTIPGINTLFDFCSSPIPDDFTLSDYLNDLINVTGINIDELDEFITEGIVITIDIVVTIPTGFCGALSDTPSCITVTDSACVVIPPDEVPTLGQWGLIILALLLINVSLLGIRQKNVDKIILQNGKKP